MKVIKNEPGTQTAKLSRFLLSYRTTPHSVSGCPLAKTWRGDDCEQGSNCWDPIGLHGLRSFEVGQPVPARDYRNRRTAWTKGVIQDRLGPLTDSTEYEYENCFGKEKLISCVNSKVEYLEPRNCELPEIDLAEPPDAIVSWPNPDPPPQSALFEKPSLPVVSPPLAEQIVPPQDVWDNSVPSVSSFPE